MLAKERENVILVEKNDFEEEINNADEKMSF